MRNLNRIFILAALALVVTGFVLLNAPARGADDIVIGVATSLNTIEGSESLKAAALAVEEINRKGGIPIQHEKHRMRLRIVDTDDAGADGEKTESVRKLERFIGEEPLHAIVVGPFRSEVLLQAIDTIARHRIPLLETIAMTPVIESLALKEPGYHYFFRTGLNTRYLADAMIHIMEFLKSRFGFSRVYIMSQDSAWARSTVAVMIRVYFDRTGWQVTGADHFPYGTSDFSAALARAQKSGAQLVLPIFDMPQSGNLAIQWQEMKIPAMLCGFISPMVGPGAWEKFGGKIAGTLNVIFELGNIPSARYPPADAFCRKYQDRYGRKIESGHGPAPSYEAVYLLADAITSAGSLEPDKLVDAIETSDRMGAMGRLRFHKGHQIIYGTDPQQEAVPCLIQWTADGRRRIVYPPSIAEGEITRP